MPAEFIALGDLLRPRGVATGNPTGDAADSVAAADSEGPGDAAGASAGVEEASADAVTANDSVHAALRDVRLFRARLADVLDATVARMLHRLAADVLVRELRLAPCDLRALVERALGCAPAVRVRLTPDDLARMALDDRGPVGHDAEGVDVVADGSLAAGDVVVEVVGGVVDLRLGVRLADVLEAFA